MHHEARDWTADASRSTAKTCDAATSHIAIGISMTPQRRTVIGCLCRNSWPRRRRNVLVSQGTEAENLVHDPYPSRSVEPKAGGARCLCCFAGCIESSSASWHLLCVDKVLTSRGMPVPKCELANHLISQMWATCWVHVWNWLLLRTVAQRWSHR